MAEFLENRHISNLINMSCKVIANDQLPVTSQTLNKLLQSFPMDTVKPFIYH